MGYRSNVRAVVYGTEEAMKKLIIDERGRENSIFDTFEDTLTIIQLDGVNALELNEFDVKWYDDYPEIKIWDKFLDRLDELISDGEELNYEFIRLGEDSDDSEERRSGDSIEWYLTISREIVSNY